MGGRFPLSGTSSVAMQRVYGHPYGQTRSIPLPGPRARRSAQPGNYIPLFEGDPQNRFMDEIAFADTPVPPRKRVRTDRGSGMVPSRERSEGERERKEVHPKGELGKVDPAKFWERMSSGSSARVPSLASSRWECPYPSIAFYPHVPRHSPHIPGRSLTR